MSISRRLGFLLAALLTLLSATIFLVLYFSVESTNRDSLQRQVAQKTEIFVKNLTVAMNQGITNVSPFIDSFGAAENVREVRVFPGTAGAIAVSKEMDIVESGVFLNGKSYIGRESFRQEEVLRTVDVILADAGCVSCHKTTVGSPLATVSVRYAVNEHEASVAGERTVIMSIVFGAIVLVFGAALIVIRRHVAKPIRNALSALRAICGGDPSPAPHTSAQDEIVELNAAIRCLHDNLLVSAESAHQIAEGNLDSSPPHASDNDLLNVSLKQTAEKARALLKEVSRVRQAVSAGDLAVRANPEQFPGACRAIVTEMNGALDALAAPLLSATHYAGRVAQGELPPKLEASYKGSFAVLATNLNACTEAVTAVLTDSVMIADAAADGNLLFRVDVTKHRGEFRKIVEAMNDTMDATVSPFLNNAEILDRMAKGDLAARAEGSWHGDHKRIAESINMVAVSLEKALRDVREAVESTAGASSQISTRTEQMAAGAQEQSSQIEELAGAMEQMSHTITESANVASSVLDLAVEVKGSAKDGVSLVEELLEAVRSLAMSFQNYSTTMMALKDSNDKIGSILEVIDDIANQTNLLALNAAIEAARAGESGRGFSVVADEVRKLAERTAHATKEIASMLKEIRTETVAAADEVNDGIAKADGGICTAERAQATLQGIADIAAATSDAIGQIASGAEEQAATAEQISKNISAINAGTHDSTARIAEVAAAAIDLNQHAQHLQTMLQWTKLSPGTGRQMNATTGSPDHPDRQSNGEHRALAHQSR